MAQNGLRIGLGIGIGFSHGARRREAAAPGDTTAPTPESAATNTAGTAIAITFSENLDESSVPAVGDLAVDGTRGTISAVDVTGAVVTLTLADHPVNDGETVTVSYTQPGSGRLRDAAGNDVAAFSNQAVTNNSTIALLVPSGDSSVQTISNFTGASTGHLHTGHLIWLPDEVTYDGSTWSYEDAASYPVLLVMPGQGATPSTMASNTLSTFKTAIGNGQLPPCIIVYPNTTDPDDSIEGWGMNSEDSSYPLEDMLRLDIPAFLQAYTRAGAGAANRAMVGFSKGGFETCRMRAKWGAAAFAVYVVAGAPRLDADLGGAAATYSTYNANGTGGTGAQQAKLFGSSSATCQAKSPFATTAGTGIFNVKGNNPDGNGAAPLLMLRSSPGDTTTQNSMNNAETRMGTLSITRTAVNLDNASFTPTHNVAQYWAAWIAEATNNLGWIRTNAGWLLP